MSQDNHFKLERPISVYDIQRAGYEVEIDLIGGTPHLNFIKEDGKILNREEINEILWILGINYKNGYCIEGPTRHRAINDEIVWNYRFIGEERLDKAWIRSPYRSDEAFFRSSKMKDLVFHIGRDLR